MNPVTTQPVNFSNLIHKIACQISIKCNLDTLSTVSMFQLNSSLYSHDLKLNMYSLMIMNLSREVCDLKLNVQKVFQYIKKIRVKNCEACDYESNLGVKK